MTFAVTRLFLVNRSERLTRNIGFFARPTVTTSLFTVPAPPGARVFLPAAPTEAGCRACPFFLPAHELCRQPFATCPNSPHRHQPWLHLPTCPQLIPAKHLPPETINPDTLCPTSP